MKSIPNNNHEVKRLQGKVTLIINGLSESGKTLAKLLAKQGSDVAIIDSQQDSELIHLIRRDVQANGRRCLILTPNTLTTDGSSFSKVAIRKIVNTFGRLDAFISYSPTHSKLKTANGTTVSQNGRNSSPLLFDRQGLTKAALKHIIKH